MIETKLVPMNHPNSHGYVIHDRVEFSKNANLLFEIARGVMMHGILDGEDSAGHTRLRPLTPEEVTTKSVDILDRLLTVCQERQWMVTKGPLDETYKEERQKAGF